MTPVGFFAFIGAGLWIGVVSVMLRDAGALGHPPPAPGAARQPPLRLNPQRWSTCAA